MQESTPTPKREALTFMVRDESETIDVARELGARFGRGTVFALHGDLGAGKTRFAQGLALSLGVTEPVCSPTYTIVNEHEGRDGLRFIHMDLYRLADEGGVEDLGFEEILERAALTVIEWPERAGGLLPEETVHVWIGVGHGECERCIRVEAPAKPPVCASRGFRVRGSGDIRA